MSTRCPCGLNVGFAAPEAHDLGCQHRRPPALRVVQDDERAPASVVQIADMPGAYTVRRVNRYADDPAEAIMNRGNSGDWYVMFGRNPDDGGWRDSATLPGRLDQAQAGRMSLELVDAFALGVPGWPALLARAAMAGEPLLGLARLHAPLLARSAGPEPWSAVCTGEGPAGSPFWRDCPTVKILAASFGMTLPRRPGDR
jgi:hypothetical protein